MSNKIRPIQKPVITRVEMEQMEADAENARLLLDSAEFKFFRDYLVSEKEIIISDFANGRIHETVEEKLYPDGSKLMIKHTKEEQASELTGRFKFIFEIIARLEYIRDIPKQALEAQENGKITIIPKEEIK